MRLLHQNSQGELALTENLSNNIPDYAILSHTWGPDCDEVTFADIQQSRGRDKAGFAKLKFCGEQARRDGIEHFWIDTCCIDKTNHVELSRNIVSMFRYYQNAKKCYVYLSDVSSRTVAGIYNGQISWEPSLRASRWFTRGWTLQELLAPSIVEFFSQQEDLLGTKRTLAKLIHEVTTIPLAALDGTPLSQFPIDERIRWTEQRHTREIEDRAYCLLGIFNVFMSPLYGEGDHAFVRLKRKINKQFGSNVAARLLNADGGRRLTATQVSEPSNADSSRSLDRNIQSSELDDIRPAKRSRISHNMAHMRQPDQIPEDNSIPFDEDKYNTLLQSLLFDRIDFRVNNVRKAHLSTCEWILHHPHFKSWHEGNDSDKNNGFLWIKGKPGCGKSTLMKAALNWIRRRSKKRSRHAIIPYFFNARASASLEKSSLGLYRTVVHHLLSSCPSLRSLFAEEFAFKDPGSSGENWTVEEFQGFLIEAVESGESFELCLFIDALDEAEYEDDVRNMITFWIQFSDHMMAAADTYRLRICLSSRHYPHITIGRGLSLVVEEQPEHGRDIETYISQQLRGLDDREKDPLRDEMVKKSGRIFLWVVLVVEMLNKLSDCGTSLLEMRARLKTIPPGLHDLFREILTKSDHGIETSILLFQWMLFSMRPLEPKELWIAVDHGKSPHISTWTKSSDLSDLSSDRLAKVILNTSRGLVEIIEATPSQAAVVQFIHETVREFLLKEDGLASIVPALAANLLGISHEILRIACLRCLETTPIPEHYKPYCEGRHENKKLLESFRSNMRCELPFLDYAIVHLFDHAEQAQIHKISQSKFLESQIDAKGRWISTCRDWWNILELYQNRKVQSDHKFVSFIAKQRYPHLLSALLRVMDDMVNTRYRGDTDLLPWISAHGYCEIVQILLEHDNAIAAHKTEDHTRWGYLSNAAWKASAKGQEKVVRILTEAGAGSHPRARDIWSSALDQAAIRGHENAVQTLIKARADVNAQEQPKYTTALCAASAHGHENIIQILINAGADIHAEGQYRYGAPYVALRFRDKHKQSEFQRAVDGLLQRYSSGTALCAASAHGHENIVKILIKAGADVNAQGQSTGTTALCAASVLDHGNVVQILIDAGANINACELYQGTALFAASKFGHDKVVQILINAGVGFDTQGDADHKNALYAASSNGNDKIVRLLLDAGADVNARGENNDTALGQASYRGYKEIVRMLIDAGADVYARGENNDTALGQALYRGYKEIVRMLIDAGADVNAQAENAHKTPLHWAVYFGYKDIVRMLIDAGADVNAQTLDFETHLWMAESQKQEIVRMLIEARAQQAIQVAPNA